MDVQQVTKSTASVSNVAMLGNWLRSWVQPDGAIFGFHNHSVWGGNPYRLADFTCGHTTWASPLLPALADAYRRQSDPRVLALLRRLIAFQTRDFQDDPEGNYAHIGFNLGELGKKGLIHNAHTNCSLALTALYGHDFLPSEDLDAIRAAFDQNRVSHGRADPAGCCNQEYARIWAKLLMQTALDDRRWHDQLVADIDTMLEHFHVRAVPDDDCEATLRAARDRDKVEPAEYYGLMILPLVLAYETYGEQRFLTSAGRLCRHVARSAWHDTRGHLRFHRLWYRLAGQWRRACEPMLIAGMGTTLEGITAYLKHEHERELEQFLIDCDATYLAYQTPRGYYVSATGWQCESDIAPSSAWHAHDLRYLIRRHGISPDFWDTFYDETPAQRTSVLLGDHCYWVERDRHWAISGYLHRSKYKLIGRKDVPRFGFDLPGEGEFPHAVRESLGFPGRPQFLLDNENIYPLVVDNSNADVTNHSRFFYHTSLDEIWAR